MQNVIVVRNVNTKVEIYKHELSEGEKPWEILQVLMQQDHGLESKDIEYIMDPEREQREAAQEAERQEAMKNFGKP